MNQGAAKKRICLIFCGGTIAMLPNKKTGALEPAKTAKELLELVPKIREIADVESVELFNIDSTDMNANHWSLIASEVYARYDKYDGFVITHGTDTMADTGSALAFALGSNLNKPVVLTGSQSYPEAVGTDAKFNLENAFRVVTSDFADVMISFGHYVFKAVRTQKRHESDFNAFMSPSYPELASIRSKIHWTPFARKAMPCPAGKLELKADFDSGILTLKVNAAIGPEMISGVLKSEKVSGIIFESLGAGNIPHRYLPVVREAVEMGIPTLITSPFVGGSTKGATTYKLGYDAVRAGVIDTSDMTSTAAYVKLMWCLAQLRKQGSTDKITAVRKMFKTDYTGEVTLDGAET